MDEVAERLDAYDDDEPSEEGQIFDTRLANVPRRGTLEVQPDETVAQVVSRMNGQRNGCALVVEEGRLVGIFTERDVLEKVASGDAGPDARVRDLMTRDPDTLPESANVAFALNRMSVEGYRHIPVVDDAGNPVGVGGMRDIIHWMVELHPAKIYNVPPVPSSFPKTPEGA